MLIYCLFLTWRHIHTSNSPGEGFRFEFHIQRGMFFEKQTAFGTIDESDLVQARTRHETIFPGVLSLPVGRHLMNVIMLICPTLDEFLSRILVLSSCELCRFYHTGILKANSKLLSVSPYSRILCMCARTAAPHKEPWLESKPDPFLSLCYLTLPNTYQQPNVVYSVESSPAKSNKHDEWTCGAIGPGPGHARAIPRPRRINTNRLAWVSLVKLAPETQQKTIRPSNRQIVLILSL